MKSFKSIVLASLVLMASACGGNTVIEGNLHEGAGREVIVKLLDLPSPGNSHAECAAT